MIPHGWLYMLAWKCKIKTPYAIAMNRWEADFSEFPHACNRLTNGTIKVGL